MSIAFLDKYKNFQYKALFVGVMALGFRQKLLLEGKKLKIKLSKEKRKEKQVASSKKILYRLERGR